MGSCVSHEASRAEYLTPQVPVDNLKALNIKQVRRRIKQGKLAPFYIGVEADTDNALDQDECPICFLSYPMLNTSLCCGKRICTTCLVMIQAQGHPGCHTTPCPFCKAPSHDVRCLGIRSMEEKLEELAEEQRHKESRRREIEEELRRDQERLLLQAQQQARVQEQLQHPRTPPPPARRRPPAPPTSSVTHHQALRYAQSSPPSLRYGSDAAPHVVQLHQFIPEDLARMYTVAELEVVMLEWAMYQSMRSTEQQSQPQQEASSSNPQEAASLRTSRQQLAQLVAALAMHGQPEPPTTTVAMVGASAQPTAASLHTEAIIPKVACNPDGSLFALAVSEPEEDKQQAEQDASALSSTTSNESPVCDPSDKELQLALDAADAKLTQALQQASNTTTTTTATAAKDSAGNSIPDAVLSSVLDDADAAYAERLRQLDMKYRSALG